MSDNMIDNWADYEPSIESDNPIDRKLARKYRLERRLQNSAKLAVNDIDTETATEEFGKIEEDIWNSDKVLDYLSKEAIECVTSIRIRSDGREVGRRQFEESNRIRILEALRNEEETSTEKFEKLSNKMIQISGQNDPLIIYECLLKQKDEWGEILMEKNRIIQVLHEELERMDVQFVKEHVKQEEDVNDLISGMKIQYNILKKACSDQLDLIEKKSELQKNVIQNAKGENWLQNFEQTERNSEDLMRRKFKKISENDTKVKELSLEYQESYREVERQLGMDINQLQRELQKVRYSCLINREKLDYNFQILKRREDENILIEAHHKRKLNKMQEAFTRMKNSVDEKRAYLNLEKTKLIVEIKKIYENIEDLKKKTNKLIKWEKKKFQDVWLSNRTEAEKLFDRLLTIDQAIHDQLLSNEGKSWQSPDTSWLSFTPYGGKSTMEVSMNRPNQEIYSVDFVNQILGKIADKTGFFIEKQLLDILEPYTIQGQKLIGLHHIFMALGVRKSVDFEYLLSLFLPYAFCVICTENNDDVGDPETCDCDFRTLLRTVQQPDDILNDLIGTIVQTHPAGEFVSFSDILQNRRITCQRNHNLVIRDKDVLIVMQAFFHSIRSNTTRKKAKTTNAISVDFVRSYWAHFTEYFTAEKQQLWTKVLQSMQNYLAILKKKQNQLENSTTKRKMPT